MISVVVIGEKGEGEQWDTIGRVLSRRYPTLLVQRDRLILPRGDAKFAICDFTAVDTVEAEQSIVLFCGGSCPSVRKIPIKHGIAVVNSCDEKALLCAGETKLPAITCGLSSRNTVTLSSMGVDDAVINLQRSVSCFDSTVAEPQEFPVRLEQPIDNFLLMALSAIIILSGDGEGLSASTL